MGAQHYQPVYFQQFHKNVTWEDSILSYSWTPRSPEKINVKKYNSHFHSNNGKLSFICVFLYENIHYKM